MSHVYQSHLTVVIGNPNKEMQTKLIDAATEFFYRLDGIMEGKSLWYKIKTRPDIVFFEGWCVGAKAQSENNLKKAVNSLEKNEDKNNIIRSHLNYTI